MYIRLYERIYTVIYRQRPGSSCSGGLGNGVDPDCPDPMAIKKVGRDCLDALTLAVDTFGQHGTVIAKFSMLDNRACAPMWAHILLLSIETVAFIRQRKNDDSQKGRHRRRCRGAVVRVTAEPRRPFMSSSRSVVLVVRVRTAIGTFGGSVANLFLVSTRSNVGFDGTA